MKHSRFSEEQILYALRQAESGTPIGDVCRQLGIREGSGNSDSVISGSLASSAPPRGGQ